MKARKILIIIFIVLVTASCSIFTKTTAYNYKDHNNPPGVVQVDSNFFIDETEITNFYWLEYVYWVKKVYGSNSTEHMISLPDTSVWLNADSCLHYNEEYFLRHPAYRDFAAVGISQKQAQQYSKWRSDRVFEYILIKTGVIQRDTNQNTNTHFTIEKYFNGQYESIKPDISIPYPKYDLPTILQRQKILEFADSKLTEEKTASNESFIKNYGTIYGYNEPINDSCKYKSDPIKWVYSTAIIKSQEIVYQLRGNVCEWSKEKKKCFGGSWKIPVDSILKADVTVVTKLSDEYTGFRNICEWKHWRK